MTLSSSSTRAEVQAAYDDNADYDLVGDVAKCKLFIHAVRILTRRMAEEIQRGNTRVRDTWVKYQGELKDAVAWLRTNDATAGGAAGGSARYADFSEFRD